MNTQDEIILADLVFQCHIGCTQQEQKKLQPIHIDVALGYDITPATMSDMVEDTINYIAIYEHIKQIVTTNTYHLIETLAAHIACTLLASYPIEYASIEIKKPRPMKKRGGAYAAVRITRYKYL